MKKAKKSVIAMSAALVMLLSLVISIVPAQEVEASYPGYDDLLYSANGLSVYTNGFSTDENGNLMFGLYLENTNINNKSEVCVKTMTINGSYKPKYGPSGSSTYHTPSWTIPAQNSRRVGVCIDIDYLSKLNVDVIDSIELGFSETTTSIVDKYVEIPIHNQKLTKAQFQGNGVYNIDGQNKNVLFGLVLDDYNYERMLPIYTIDGSSTMYRLYNGSSGEHFYTSNYSEANLLASSGWGYEGAAWFAPATGDDVYRLYNPNSGDHHYTTNAGEKDALVSAGWGYEGVAWKSGGKVPMYRAYNPNAVTGNHHYTSNKDELNYLISIGWQDEGKAWYALR